MVSYSPQTIGKVTSSWNIFALIQDRRTASTSVSSIPPLGAFVKAFTLLELLVVIALASLMLVLVPPLFSGAVQSTEVKAVARELAATLKKVRGRAIASQDEAVLTLDLTHKRYSTNAGKPAKKLPDRLHLSLFTARSEQISGQIGSIRFYPDGSATGGRITVTGGTRSLYVDVDWLTGKVTIDD
jgi:general secretion pathway protein H